MSENFSRVEWINDSNTFRINVKCIDGKLLEKICYMNYEILHIQCNDFTPELYNEWFNEIPLECYRKIKGRTNLPSFNALQ